MGGAPSSDYRYRVRVLCPAWGATLTGNAGISSNAGRNQPGDVQMTRHVFFSFHYQRDIVRVNQIRILPEVIDEAAAGFKDSSLWEEAKKKGDDAVKKLIDDGLRGTSVTVVCIGNKTAGRKFINYEI